MKHSPRNHPPSPPAHDLEIKDAQLIFNGVWKELEARIWPRKSALPKGADPARRRAGRRQGNQHRFHPGAARHHRPAHRRQRTARQPGGPADQGPRRHGRLDREVVGILFRKLLEPEQQNGAILDGFPRTKVQVECLKMLYDEMIALRREFAETPASPSISGSRCFTSWCSSWTSRKASRAS